MSFNQMTIVCVVSHLVKSIAWSCCGTPVEFLIQAVTASRATEESTVVPDDDVTLLFSTNCALDYV